MTFYRGILDSPSNPMAIIGGTTTGSEDGRTTNCGLFDFGQFQPADVQLKPMERPDVEKKGKIASETAYARYLQS